MEGLDKASAEQMKRLIQIDDNIAMIRTDLKEYARQAREQIRDLEKQKARLREELGQLPLFGGDK